MDQLELFKPVTVDKLSLLSREELITFYRCEQELRIQFQKENERLRALADELKQKHLFVNEQYITLKNKIFGKSSEREPSDRDRRKANRGGPKKRKVQLPSLRYPDAPLIERDVELEKVPNCDLCGDEMYDLGITENSEFLTVIPAQYVVVRQKRHQYGCRKCHGSIITAPAPSRIKPGSAYSDEMVADVALSKYCDLIPIERYSSIAGREGLTDIPPNSLIKLTHYLADFVEPVYNKIKKEVLSSRVLHADETPHKMLEGGGDKSSWYLWGFSNTKGSSYFEIRDTRSGDVASELLVDSKCEHLVSDVFTGYRKAVRETNKVRKRKKKPPIKNCYCNAHARRKFKEAKEKFPDEAELFGELYKKIYRLEKIASARPPNRILRVRRLMKPLFESMKEMAKRQIMQYSSKSSIAKAMSYFMKNYNELTAFVSNAELPIDNNLQERQLRNPVIGRKTWYGNHSQRGAKTSAILFSLVESCKLSGVNPRVYFKKIIEKLHRGVQPPTPSKFKGLGR